MKTQEQAGLWYVEEYGSGRRLWVRREGPDGAIETIAQDICKREDADMLVNLLNSQNRFWKLVHIVQEAINRTGEPRSVLIGGKPALYALRQLADELDPVFGRHR